MKDWRQTTTTQLLTDGVIEIGDGYRAKNVEFVEDGGLPFVRVGDVDTTIRLNGRDELPIENKSKYGNKVSAPFDSLITMKGTVGRVAYVSEACQFVYSPQISYWRSHDPTQIHPRWLRYWLESPEFLNQALATKGATDMADYINLRDQRRMRITVPPPLDQKRIAAVLGSIDDLIENNRRRIELLEQMAQAVYQEWFVCFRYPQVRGRKFPIKDSAEAVHILPGTSKASIESDRSVRESLPRGWEDVLVGDVLELRYGKALKRGHRKGGPVAVCGSSGIIGWHDESLVDGPTIVVGRKGNVGRVTWIPFPCYPIDTTFFVVTDLPPRFVFEQLRLVEFTNSHAAVPGLSRDQVYAMPFLKPPRHLMENFEQFSMALGGDALIVQRQADKLRLIRDLLLPK
ncbi:MAG: restriction endonuclease subunit S, partial [Actinomycetota bacterium]